MSPRLSFYAFEPGAPGVPAASATGVFVSGLLKALRDVPSLELQLRWLRPAGAHRPGRIAEWAAAGRWLTNELTRLLGDRSEYLLFIYPKLPVLAHVSEPLLLAAAQRAFQLLRLKCRVAGQRTLVVVEDLPIEMAEGRAAGGGPRAELEAERLRGIERSVFSAAYRLIVPSGFVAPIRERHRLDPGRFRTFRRNVYLPAGETVEAPPVEFESGKVNFFYSGSIDSHVAVNFREMLRSIRNAPDTRLHVCGPGRDAVREWLAELDVPNVRHYGLLGIAEHDWLAQRCDVGLILYPSDNPYNHLTPTMKYSAYLANGLAVLSTDLRCVADNVRIDGVGRSLPINELALELLRWATRPALWREHKARAEAEASVIRSGEEMKAWIRELRHEDG